MFKHQVLDHQGEEKKPTFEMRIARQHKSAFERQVHEAVLIEMGGGNILNSRGEFNRCEIPRLRVEVGERIVAFDKGKGEEEMTTEEDALLLLARKRIKEGEYSNTQSTKRRKTKPSKPARRAASKRERTTTEIVKMEMKSYKRMRMATQRLEVASEMITTVMTGPTEESIENEAEMTEREACGEMTGAGLSTKVSELEFYSNKAEKKPSKPKEVRRITQFFNKLSKGGQENENGEKTKINPQFKLKTQFGKSSRKSTNRLRPKSSSMQHQVGNYGLAAKPITAYFSPINKRNNEKSCDGLGINS